MSFTEAYSLDLGDTAAWQASSLAFDRPTQKWRRSDLRALGFGDVIDEHIRLGRCAPDRA